MSNNMKERLRRVEKVVTGEEPVTYTQAMVLVLDLISGVYNVVEPVVEQVPKNVTAIEVLKTRVTLGIGLTVIVGIIGGIVLVTGG